jgi:hypothetical protein
MLVDANPDASRTAPAALSMTKSPAEHDGLRFYTVTGLVLGDIVKAADGRTKAISQVHLNSPEAVPELDWRCWLLCMTGIPLTIQCLQNCFDCASGLYPYIYCTYCIACAGPRAVTCFKRCP